MTELLLSEEMRAIEQAAIQSGGVTGVELMERAGQGVVAAILERWPEYAAAPASVCVLCGPGNNGGDGFVVARLLAERGWEVYVLAAPERAGAAPDAALNRARWTKMGAVHALDRDGLRAVPDCALYVDAVFGIGLTRPAQGDLAELLSYLAGSGGDHGFFAPRMVAVDVPSGLCADSGKVLGCPTPDPFHSLAPFAALTVTFETPKPGHFIGHGPELCGELVVVDIGLEAWRVYREPRVLRPTRLSLVPPMETGVAEPHRLFAPTLRPKAFGHKYDHGHVVVVTGGKGPPVPHVSPRAEHCVSAPAL
ncbi:NAD(P)H-hydrate epimerase [Roseobacteraceae bacterium S113]